MTSPSSAKSLFDSGLRNLKAGKLQEAEAAIAQAISLDEKNPNYWIQLGAVWMRMGHLQKALDANQMALSLSPNHADALYNIGSLLIQAGKSEIGLSFLEKAYAAGQDSSLAEKLGDMFSQEKLFKKAAFYFSKALASRKTDEKIQRKLAASLSRAGEISQAASLYMDLVNRFPGNQEYLAPFVEACGFLTFQEYSDKARNALLACLKAEGLPTRNLRTPWTALLMTDPRFETLRLLAAEKNAVLLTSLAPVLDDSFFCLGLQKIPALTAAPEKIATILRKTFLLDWKNAANWPKESLVFLTSLAIQCWYNDFVFYETAAEREAVLDLESFLKTSLSDPKTADDTARLFSLYGCYRPLYEIAPQATPSNLPFSKGTLYHLKPLIKAQILNPHREQELRPTIPSFCEIKDAVSKSVQSMYEQRPYPRWTSVNVGTIPESLAELSRNMEALVAGCGTGQEPALYANAMPYAHITAVDLSLPSIAYAKRMAEELGYLSKVDFRRGDLMEIEKIGKHFDFVASSGVLHHLKDPEKGLAAILSVLKPGGRLSVSLYSEIARTARLGPAAAYIQEKGYTSSTDDIRQFRHDLLSLPEDDPRRRCAAIPDFYSLSECNDLLFHVQEHRYTFPQIKALTEKFSLELVHIYLRPDAVKKYAEMFPSAPGAFDFDRLHAFEQRNPETFLGMYKLYFRRKGEESAHPLDPLIRLGAI
jgi:SAM-dependent methyltransferase/Tfp pilus assembly protein PilF